MIRFSINQKWQTKDGKLHGVVMQIFDEGGRGVVLITDDKAEAVDKYNGTAVQFQGAGHWQIAS